MEHEFPLFSNINLNDAPTQEQVHINIPFSLEDRGDTQAFLLTPSNQLTYSDMITPFQAQLPPDLTSISISTSQLSQSVTPATSEIVQTVVSSVQQTESNEEQASVAVCKKCNQGFQSISLYNSHQKIHENDSSPSYADCELGNTFTCPEDGCDKKYKTEHLLRRHLKRAVYFLYAHRYLSKLYVYFCFP